MVPQLGLGVHCAEHFYNRKNKIPALSDLQSKKNLSMLKHLEQSLFSKVLISKCFYQNLWNLFFS